MGFLSCLFLFWDARPNYGVGRIKAIADSRPGPALITIVDAAKPNSIKVERDPLENARLRRDKDLGSSEKMERSPITSSKPGGAFSSEGGAGSVKKTRPTKK
jgi:hypothetical protein